MSDTQNCKMGVMIVFLKEYHVPLHPNPMCGYLPSVSGPAKAIEALSCPLT